MVTKTEPKQAEKKLQKPQEGLQRVPYPFAAIIGQERMKLALILSAINPQIGGVLIRGERGTGKTIAVRGLADILPKIEAVSDCRFRCNPEDPSEMCVECRAKFERGERLPSVKMKVHIAELPIGATEDRVLGTLNIEKAIKEGLKALDLGILADANRGILYVDNINLLDDHVVDVLLDSAAMGVNVVEREGISVSHPAKFILFGTMNPEEGELRPQLHDRLALQVAAFTVNDLKSRVQIVKNAEEYEKNPEAFRQKYKKETQALTDKIEAAKKFLSSVEIPAEFLRIIARISTELDVDGHRPDIIVVRTAMTHAAFEGRKMVTEDDLRLAAELTLNFRMRRTPFEEAALGTSKFQQVLDHAKLMEEQAKQRQARKAEMKEARIEAKKLEMKQARRAKAKPQVEGKTPETAKPKVVTSAARRKTKGKEA
jgi:Mg-chelatase subunit ChlI